LLVDLSVVDPFFDGIVGNQPVDVADLLLTVSEMEKGNDLNMIIS